MPTPSRARTGLRLSRRSALAAVLALGGATAACTPETGRGRSREDVGRSPEPVEPKVDPDVAVAAAALAAQRSMVELLEATVARHRRLEDLLTPVLDTHRAHVALLDDAVPDDGSGDPSPSSSPGASPGPAAPETPGGRRTPVARRRPAALADVVAAERSLTTTTKQHAFRAQSGAFARVLGSMAAAAAQHAAVLGSASGQGERS